MLKLVPFNQQWIDHDKLDLHAIYRRPSLVEDEYGERVPARDAAGNVLWDLTTALPVRQHNHWVGKGFEYVTLANATGPEGALGYVHAAARSGTLQGGVPRDYSQDPRTGGPWNVRKYLEGQIDTASLAADDLRADVERYGSATVESLRRRTDPTFRLPTALQGIEPHREPVAVGAVTAGAVAEGEPAPKATRKRQ